LAATIAVRRFAAALASGMTMQRSGIAAVVACVVGLTGMTPAAGQHPCRPALAFTEVRFSPMRPPTMERTWTAVVSVDASRCSPHATGSFAIGFVRLSESAPDTAFRRTFTWRPPAVTVDVVFAADEAVERYWIDRITPCACTD
jgi:hypothetical protein